MPGGDEGNHPFEPSTQLRPGRLRLNKGCPYSRPGLKAVPWAAC